jgi:hypothetical protein
MLKHLSSRMEKVLVILLAVLFVLSLTVVAASAHHEGLGGYGMIGYEMGGYGPGGIYNTPYYEGNPNEYYAAVNQPDYGGYVYYG